MIKRLLVLLAASLSFSAVTPNTTTVYSLLVSKNAQVNGYLKAGGVSTNGTVTANKYIGSGASLTGLPVYLTTANADLRFAPIGIQFLTTANADLRYTALGATANRAITANYATTANYANTIPPQPVYLTTDNADLRFAPIGITFLTTANADLRYVTPNYGFVTFNTIYATNYLNAPAGGGSGITTANADLRYVTPSYGFVTFNTIYATNYLNVPTVGGSGGGITTENADLRYVSANYFNNVTFNKLTYITTLSVAMAPVDDAVVVSGAIGVYGGGVERVKIDGVTGTINAVAFVGDGKGITGVTATAAPAGSNQWIQFNSNGTTSGDAGLQWESSTNSLIIDDTGGSIRLTGVQVDPNLPPAGSLQLYSKSIGGRMMPKWKAPSGVDTAIQPFLGTNTVYLWSPNTGTTAAGTGFGTVWPNATGTITHPTVANTNFTTAIKVMQCTNVVTTPFQILGLTASTATLANVWRGSRPNEGGFYMYSRVTFPLVARVGGVQVFVGLSSMITGMVATKDFNLTGDFCGFWQGVSDNINTMGFMTRDNATTRISTFNVPVGIRAATAYDFTIYSKPNGNEIYYRMVEVSSNTVITENNTSTNLPRNTIFMGPQVQMSNGTGNVTATTVAIGINKMYLECDN